MKVQVRLVVTTPEGRSVDLEATIVEESRYAAGAAPVIGAVNAVAELTKKAIGEVA
jgi:hypothetical protein